MEFDYEGSSPNITVAFRVLWGGGTKALDNPEDVHLLVYDCEKAASNCKECRDTPEEFGCGWCEKSGTCQLKERCEGGNWMGNGARNCTGIQPEPEPAPGIWDNLRKMLNYFWKRIQSALS